MIYLYLFLAFLVGYLLGNINFARIFSWLFAKKDITTVGSKNPGAMNMLRTRGFGEALLTLLFEGIKSGVPALSAYFLFNHFFAGIGDVAYVITAFGAIVGHCFPVFYRFKGGKGVACTFGMFLFNPHSWWMSLVMFVVCFGLFFLIDYPFIISNFFILCMTIFLTCISVLSPLAYFGVIVGVLWANVVMIWFLHRGNIKRFVQGKENKVHFADKIFKHKKKDDQNLKEQNSSAQVEENSKEEQGKSKNDAN